MPEFQRDWKWRKPQVLKLYDSVRKGYPIGSFLTLEASEQLFLSPRLFAGMEGRTDLRKLKSYVLDGQQRITAGLALYYGLGKSHYFLNLEALWREADDASLDFEDDQAVQSFADGLDEEERYIKGRASVAYPESQLSNHLFWTPYLADDAQFAKAKNSYLQKYPERGLFMDLLIAPHFKLREGPTVPITVLDSDMSVEAITRVFETLNTTGSQLTPVEITIAVLYANGIHLRELLDDYRDSTTYYSNTDRTGERLLQSIALLDGKDPKLVKLPTVIRKDNYDKYNQRAIAGLEFAGEFLSERFGAALNRSGDLISYPAQMPPLGIARNDIAKRFAHNLVEQRRWIERLERWYVGSILHKRYEQSQPRIQKEDWGNLTQWIELGNGAEPAWLEDVRISRLDNLRPSSANGKLIVLLQSRQSPLDPLNGTPVGGPDGSIVAADFHHIFPKAFCEQHIADWDSSSLNHDVALNIMPVTPETNGRWSKMDPTNQVQDVRNRHGDKVGDAYAPFFINERCIEILERPNKKAADFQDFIAERARVVSEYISSEWEFRQDSNLPDDEEDE